MKAETEVIKVWDKSVDIPFKKDKRRTFENANIFENRMMSLF